ncbi:tetratricopeptide repeat protein, partial [bacterium]|nr:tetratricopeptide repeat protein [bacterium]
MSEILKKLEKIQNQSAEQTPSDSQFQESTKAPAREPQAQLAPRSKTILLSSFFGGLFLAMIGLFFSPLLSKKTSQEPRRPQVSISQKLPSQERSPAMTQVEPTLLKTVEELTKTGKIDEAISRLETETGNNPFLTRALFTLANLYQKKNKPDRATSTLMRILQIEPKNPLAYNNIGVIQLRQKRYKEAASFLKKACEYAPQTPDPWLNLAITHEQSMQLADSVENY